MTGPVSTTEARQLFPGLRKTGVGCHEVSKGITLEVLEAAS